MKKLFRFGLLLLFTVACTSCHNNDNDVLYYSYVTVQAPTSSNLLTLRRDAGAFLYVKTSSVNISNLAEGDRLIVYYRIRGNSDSGNDNFDIDLRRYYMVLTKDPILQSFLADNPAEDTALGNNAVRVGEAWFGGRYLNINFSFYSNPNSSVTHFINLVADDVTFDGTTMTVYLRHNAYTDLPASVGQMLIRSGLVSFDFVNLLDDLELTTSPDFVLVWFEYDGIMWDQPLLRRERTLGKFTPWTQDRIVTSTMVDNLNDVL